MSAHRIFFLSPASCGGKRADLLLRERADFPLAHQIRSPTGAPIGDVFSFLSGLYFRGKLAYSRAFARPPTGAGGVLVITTSRGLVSPDMPVRVNDLIEFAGVSIDVTEPRYAGPLGRTARAVAAAAGDACEAVLLGSVAGDKYVGVLGEIFGSRLVFPSEFVGRGDMSRGGLMLRCVAERRELEYVTALGTVRRGNRPPRLTPITAPR